MLYFPNETSFGETPLRIKEIAGDRRANGVSGPSPAADFTSVGAVFSGPQRKVPQLVGEICLLSKGLRPHAAGPLFFCGMVATRRSGYVRAGH